MTIKIMMIRTFSASTWRHDESVPGAARCAVVVHTQVVTNLHHDDDCDDGEDDDDCDLNIFPNLL